MRYRLTIDFLDGTRETITGYRHEVRDGILRVRTSHNTSYRDDWTSYPLTSIKKWSRQ